MTGPSPDQAWQQLTDVIALCGPPPCRTSPDPDAWFDYANDPGRRDTALAGCAACPGADECLAYATAAGERWGIWGGTTPSERTPRQDAA